MLLRRIIICLISLNLTISDGFSNSEVETANEGVETSTAQTQGVPGRSNSKETYRKLLEPKDLLLFLKDFLDDRWNEIDFQTLYDLERTYYSLSKKSDKTFYDTQKKFFSKCFTPDFSKKFIRFFEKIVTPEGGNSNNTIDRQNVYLLEALKYILRKNLPSKYWEFCLRSYFFKYLDDYFTLEKLDEGVFKGGESYRDQFEGFKQWMNIIEEGLKSVTEPRTEDVINILNKEDYFSQKKTFREILSSVYFFKPENKENFFKDLKKDSNYSRSKLNDFLIN